MGITISLEGRSAIVTGGGSGVGFGIARRLVHAGAAVTIVGRRIDVLEAAAATLRAEAVDDTQVRAKKCDVTIEEDVEAAMSFAAEPTGRLDIAVANVGGGCLGPLLMQTGLSFQTVFDANVVSTLLTFKHAVNRMRDGKGGSLVAISSVQAIRPARYFAPYSVSKAALDMLVRIAAQEFAPFGIRVNAIRAGLINTEGTKGLSPAMLERIIGETLLGRIGTPEEVGDSVVYLVSDLARWVTGQFHSVCGGLSASDGFDFSDENKKYFGNDIFDSLTRGPGPVRDISVGTLPLQT